MSSSNLNGYAALIVRLCGGDAITLCMHIARRRLNSGNACYHSVQNLLASRLLSKNVKVRIYKTIILAVVLNGCETWSLTIREEYKLSVFENRVLKSHSKSPETIVSLLLATQFLEIV
jgi:hypothetical protein